MSFENDELFSKNLPFWDKLNEQQKELLYKHTSFASYNKGQNIHGTTGNCTGAVYVKSGVLRTYMLSDEGKEITLYRLYPGDICMLSASCVLQTITFDVFVDAEEKSDVYIISSGFFSQLMQENVYVENFALKTAPERS